MRGNTLRCVLVTVLLCINAVQGGSIHSFQSGLSRDPQVNVCDIQKAVAMVLGNGAAITQADLNADGRVDILDIQRMLCAVQENQDLGRQETPKETDFAIIAPRAVMPLRNLDIRWEAARLEECDAAVDDVKASLDWVSPPRYSLNRYSGQLTSHAPPYAV